MSFAAFWGIDNNTDEFGKPIVVDDSHNLPREEFLLTGTTKENLLDWKHLVVRIVSDFEPTSILMILRFFRQITTCVGYPCFTTNQVHIFINDCPNSCLESLKSRVLSEFGVQVEIAAEQSSSMNFYDLWLYQIINHFLDSGWFLYSFRNSEEAPETCCCFGYYSNDVENNLALVKVTSFAVGSNGEFSLRMQSEACRLLPLPVSECCEECDVFLLPTGEKFKLLSMRTTAALSTSMLSAADERQRILGYRHYLPATLAQAIEYWSLTFGMRNPDLSKDVSIVTVQSREGDVRILPSHVVCRAVAEIPSKTRRMGADIAQQFRQTLCHLDWVTTLKELVVLVNGLLPADKYPSSRLFQSAKSARLACNSNAMTSAEKIGTAVSALANHYLEDRLENDSFQGAAQEDDPFFGEMTSTTQVAAPRKSVKKRRK